MRAGLLADDGTITAVLHNDTSGYGADIDVMLTTLEGENGLLGLLLVGERVDEVSTFGQEDEKLLRTFAGHAALLLENEQLEQSLAKLTDLEAQLR